MPEAKALDRIVEGYRVFHCVECGKCTGACPMAQVDRDFSPRLVAKRVIEEGLHSPYVRERTWSCLTCGLCQERCPIGIAFAEFVRELRLLYRRGGDPGHPSHGGALHILMRMQAAAGLAQNRLDWKGPELRTASRGEVLYFVGCLPYFDTFFSEFGLRLREIAVATVRVLNAIGVEPVVLADERCCGHDLFCLGDERSFSELRQLNMRAFRKAGARTIVTACAECSYTLSHLYAAGSEPLPYEVMHLSTYLHRAGFRPGRSSDRTATYQDPCRLGRFQGVYAPPRELLGSVLELREMSHAGPGAWCCGNSAWLHCDRYSKQLQIERLTEALDTGSDFVVTACPKCQIHLTCASRDANLLKALGMQLQDLSVVLAAAMERDRTGP